MATSENEQLLNKIDFLKNVSIFKEVAPQSLAAIALVLKSQALDAATNVFKKGDSGTSMYIIEEGRVKVHDEDYVFNELTIGDVFGEYALLDTESRSASITTISPTRLLKLDQQDFYCT